MLFPIEVEVFGTAVEDNNLCSHKLFYVEVEGNELSSSSCTFAAALSQSDKLLIVLKNYYILNIIRDI